MLLVAGEFAVFDPNLKSPLTVSTLVWQNNEHIPLLYPVDTTLPKP
jgi:hypothetical protein